MHDHHGVYEQRTILQRIGRGRMLRVCEGPDDASQVAHHYLRHLADEANEVVAVVLLDGRHRAIGWHIVARGRLNACSVEPADIFRAAIIANAAAIVLAHNHPSGDPTPSDDDRRLTQRIYRCGETLGVHLLDHIVIASSGYVSLREIGGLPK